MKYIVDKFTPFDNVIQVPVKKENSGKYAMELKAIGAKVLMIAEMINCTMVVVEKDDTEKQVIEIGFKYARNEKA